MKHAARPALRSRRGFTLLELMIALAIVAIISAVAYPQYAQYVVRSKRSAASACLTEMAQYMERVYTTNLRYDQNNGTATVLPATACRTDLNGRYALVFATGMPTERTFTLRAEPQGSQATADAACGTLTMTHTGAKGVTGTGATVAACWR